MSIFEGQTEGHQTEQTTPQTAEDWLAKVVETKGEKFKDPQVLAKSKLEADTHIKNLEVQLAQLREELGKENYSQKLLEQLQNKAPITTEGSIAEVQNKDGGTKPSDTKSELSEDILKALVEKTLTDRDKQNTVKQNVDLVEKELVGKYGTEAKAYVEKKATELGMSLQRLQELAAESPSAFFTLIGEPKTQFQPPVNGSIRTEGVHMQATSERNFTFYQKLRKENKKLYYEPKTQQQMVQDKMRLGDKFGN